MNDIDCIPEGWRCFLYFLLGLEMVGQSHEASSLLGQDRRVLHDGRLGAQFGQLPAVLRIRFGPNSDPGLCTPNDGRYINTIV